MTEVAPSKRKVDELEDPSTVDDEVNSNKRAKQDIEEVDETVEGNSAKGSEGDLEDELTTSEKPPVLEKRTRGVRVNYTELQDNEDNEDEDEDVDDENEEEEEEEVVDEGQANVEDDEVADKHIGENGTKGEQASDEDGGNDTDDYEEDDDEE